MGGGVMSMRTLTFLPLLFLAMGLFLAPHGHGAAGALVASPGRPDCASPRGSVPSDRALSPTATVAPPRPLTTADERAARGVARAFVDAVLLGRQGEARPFLAPEYATRAGDLYAALGLPPAESVEWLIGGSEQERDHGGVIVEVPLRAESAKDCSVRSVTARLHLARLADARAGVAWRIVAIDAVAR